MKFIIYTCIGCALALSYLLGGYDIACRELVNFTYWREG
jgi:hypothetical protein